MSFTLISNNPDLKPIEVGSNSWVIYMQDFALGYVLNYGTGLKSGSYVYEDGNKGTPTSNDGYIVTAEQAKAMALVAKGFVFVQRAVNEQWEALEQVQREHYEGSRFCRQSVHEDHLTWLEAFAAFAEKSNGFTIN